MSGIERSFATFRLWSGDYISRCKTLESCKASYKLFDAVYTATKKASEDDTVYVASIISNPNEDVIITIKQMCACAKQYDCELVASGDDSALLIWVTLKA